MKPYDNIKRIAKKRGMSLQDVAEKSGLSSNIIYQYRNKINPTEKTLAKIAKTLDVDVAELQSKSVEDDLNIAIDNARSFDGKPISDKDREKVKNILRGYFED